MIHNAIISVTASFVLFGAWTVNLVSYHPATDSIRWPRGAAASIEKSCTRLTAFLSGYA